MLPAAPKSNVEQTPSVPTPLTSPAWIMPRRKLIVRPLARESITADGLDIIPPTLRVLLLATVQVWLTAKLSGTLSDEDSSAVLPVLRVCGPLPPKV